MPEVCVCVCVFACLLAQRLGWRLRTPEPCAQRYAECPSLVWWCDLGVGVVWSWTGMKACPQLDDPCTLLQLLVPAWSS